MLNPIFTSHMVFSAGKPVRIYGEAEGAVTVTFAGQTAAVEACGPWEAELPAMPCGGPYTLTVSCGAETVTLSDVWVGEVYLFAGQSNMQFKLGESSWPREKWTNEPRARMFSTERIEKNEFFHPEDGWRPCVTAEAENWSAIAYHVCTQLAAEKNIAVGAVFCYQGASVIESWLPAGAPREAGITSITASEYHKNTFYHPWNEEGVLYSECFSQVKDFNFTGVFWYQGETDAVEGECDLYGQEMALLIDIWRYDLRDDALPFVIFQLADYDTRKEGRWQAVQAGQLAVQEMRGQVKTVITADVCESDGIHPPTKSVLSQRAAVAMSGMV